MSRVVGVLGGTFNPVHSGHLAMARETRSRLALDRVLLMPCATPPHKAAPRMSTLQDRVAMLEAAIAGEPGLEISMIEAHSGVVCYTIDTLRRLRHGGWGLDPVFLMGMDSLVDLPTWREYRALVAEFDVVVVDRRSPDDAEADLAPEVRRRLVSVTDDTPPPRDLGRGGRVIQLNVAPPAVSSREIRSRAADGEPLDGLVPAGVARYIRVSGLYKRQDREDGR